MLKWAYESASDHHFTSYSSANLPDYTFYLYYLSLGNTCYMNSILQALRAIPELRTALDSPTLQTQVSPPRCWTVFFDGPYEGGGRTCRLSAAITRNRPKIRWKGKVPSKVRVACCDSLSSWELLIRDLVFRRRGMLDGNHRLLEKYSGNLFVSTTEEFCRTVYDGWDSKSVCTCPLHTCISGHAPSPYSLCLYDTKLWPSCTDWIYMQSSHHSICFYAA